jgi:O-antigen ligase
MEGSPVVPPAASGGVRAPTSLWRHVQRAPYQLRLVWFLWFVVFYDPHRFLALFLGGLVLKLPQLVFALMGVVVLTRWPPRTWYPAFLAYFSVVLVVIPFAVNPTVGSRAVKFIILEFVLALATPMFIRTARDWVPIVVIVISSYLWYAVQGVAHGFVPWHPIVGNQDGFGPHMLIGASLAYYVSQGTSLRWLQRLCLLTMVLGVLGLVTSFTRGATLAAIAVAGILWLRSPRKGRTAVAVAVGAVLLVIAAQIFFPAGAFWAEIRSVFEEGTESGTGSDRITLWRAAWKVFLANPILGVGPNNFGPFAAEYFDYGEVGGDYMNPVTLYDRDLHSVYFTVLSESGMIGVVTFIVLLIDFWRRNRVLRTKWANAVWQAGGGGEVDLRLFSLGLELAMIGFLLNGLFYPLLYVHWLYSFVFINAALEFYVRDTKRRLQVRAAAPAGRSG